MKRYLRPETLYYAFLILSGLFAGSIFIVPLMIDSSNGFLTGAGAVFYKISAFFCAQVPERSFHFGTTQLPVDARMTGIFVGGFLGLLAPALRRPKRDSWIYLIVGLLMTLPLVIDGTTQTILIWRESNNILRLATGLLAGTGVSYALGAILLEDKEKTGFRRGLVLPPLRAAVAVVLIVLLAFIATGAFYGSGIVTRSEAMAKAGRSLPNGANRLVYWLPPNSGISIAFDPYADRYDDVVLNNLIEARGLRSTLGAWIIASVAKAPRISRTPFLPETAGKFIYIDAATGRIILNTVH